VLTEQKASLTRRIKTGNKETLFLSGHHLTMESFWHHLENISGLPEIFHLTAIGFYATAFILYYFFARERKRLRTVVVLFTLASAGLLASTAIFFLCKGQETALSKSIGCASLFLGYVALINVTSICIYAALLRPIRLEPPKIVQELLIAFAYLAVAILLLKKYEVNLLGLVATSAVLTAVIGFSLQETLGNIMGGMALQMERTIKPGDWIRIDDVEGRVVEIRWRQTSIETRNWDTIVIPNSLLMKGRVTLLGRRQGFPTQRRQWIHFRVDHNHLPTRVIRTVESALHGESMPFVSANPPPDCTVGDLRDNDCILYAVRYWLTDFERTESTDSMMRTRVFAALHRAKIPFAVPSQSIFVTEHNETFHENRENRQLDGKTKTIQRLELFNSLTPDEQKNLAEGLVDATYLTGETITRQGAESHCLYILIEGEAEIRVSVDNSSQRVAVVHAPDFFGEMGLLTGEPRSASVISLTDSYCYLLDKEVFESILVRRPEIAEQMAFILTKRREELNTVREIAGEDAKRQRMNGEQIDLLNRIRKFFGLGSN